MIMERRVTVVPCSRMDWKHCSVAGKRQNCKRKPKFLVFGGDGNPTLSRLDSTCCVQHLPIAVRRAYTDNEQARKKEEAMVLAAERQKALKIVEVWEKEKAAAREKVVV